MEAYSGYLYVCSGYPDICDVYVGAHEKNMCPKGTLADRALHNMRIMAHRALDAILVTDIIKRRVDMVMKSHMPFLL